MNTQVKNAVSSLLAQLVTVLCGFIIPRLILLHYGTEMNGLAQSVTRFLQVMVIMELGLGAVVPAALYKPLVNKDTGKISSIISSAYHTYRRIGAFLLIYMIILIPVFIYLTRDSFPWYIPLLMVVFIGIGNLYKYWAGTPDRALLIADQKGYIVYITNIVSTVISTLIAVLLIISEVPYQWIKLSASVITIISMIFLCRFVDRTYGISRDINPDKEPIPQKWNGIAQHVSYIILEYTDIILLTVMMSLREVSVYSVYYMVISSIRRVYISLLSSLQPKLGNLQAKGNKSKLNEFFDIYETGSHYLTVLFFSCTAVLILPFVRIYTYGVTDADYEQPLFALFMVLAYAVQCFKEPYDKLILAAGHFRQTQTIYAVAALINICASILLVWKIGLPGVVAGTLLSMLFLLISMSYYASKGILDRPYSRAMIRLLADVLLISAIIFVTGNIRLQVNDFYSWIIKAFITFFISAVIITVPVFIFRRKALKELFHRNKADNL